MSTAEVIIKRYSAEAADANLSCGGNIQYLELKPGESVLDLGCGRGRETLQAARAVGGEGSAWGVDITPGMIEAAQEAAQAVQVKNVAFLLAPMEEIPLPDGSVNAIISNCAINHVADKAAVYREIYRLLKPGGRFVVSDIMTEQPLPSYIKEDPEAIADCFGGAITLKEYDTALAAAGFAAIEILKERHYPKNGFPMISRTFRSFKPPAE